MNRDNGLSLLDEFSAGIHTADSSPELIKMANAKWQGELVSAIADLDAEQISRISDKFESLAAELIIRLGQDGNDLRLRNVAMQILIPPVKRELKESGCLTGEWLPAYAEAIKQIPAFIRVTTNNLSASTSMGMTLANHHAELLSVTNEFSFLRPPEDIASWAHSQIDNYAHTMAKTIAPHDEIGPAYQNQLNVHRRLFLSAYRAEARQWQTMLNSAPETASLYASGLPLGGVENRFNEQAKHLSQIISCDIGITKTTGISR